jgi:hypothetical protein
MFEMLCVEVDCCNQIAACREKALVRSGNTGRPGTGSIHRVTIVVLSCCALGQDRAAESAMEAAACWPRDVEFEMKIDASVHPTPLPEVGKE